jgi:hypothetical protein
MLANLRVLFGRLVDIVLLRGGPETLPASPALLATVVALNAVVSVAVVSLIPAAPAFSPLELIVSIFVPLAWYHVAFKLVKKPERFVQTMTAFFGVNTLFQPVVSPMFAAMLPYLEKQDPSLPPPAALSLLFLAITVWLLVVWVRIVHAAFEWPYVGAVIFVFAQNFAAIFIYALVFGTPAGKT